MNVISGHKILAAVIGALVLLVLCAGTATAVTNAANAHNAAVQRAAAIATHNRAVARAKAAAQARAIAAANAKAASAERAARQAQRAARRAATRPAVAVPQPAPVVVQPAAPAAAGGLTPVGVGSQGEEVYANAPTTSTAFALNVESDYWNTPGMNDSFTSYSPVTGQDYYMTAVDSGSTVTVTNSNGCVIQFSDGS